MESGPLALTIFLALAVGLLIYTFFFHKKRSAQIKEIASKRGLSELSEDSLSDRVGDLTDLLYPNGVACELKKEEERKRKISFRTGWGSSQSSGTLTVFDVSIGSRYLRNMHAQGGDDASDRESRKYGMPLTQTVVSYTLLTTLPQFAISERLPFKDEYVSIDGSDTIGQHYRICALESDKSQVGLLIGPEILRLLQSERLWSIESHGDRLFIFQKNWLTPAKRFESLLNTAERVMKELSSNTETRDVGNA